MSIDLAQRLLDAADNDELMARSLLPVEGVTDAGIGFHAQQAIEKSIKAILALQGIEFPFTHDLDRLSELCAESGVAPPPTLDGAQRLTPFAAAERYGSPIPIELDRDQALRWAAAAVEWARQQIESASDGDTTNPQ
ncbi:MAG: HEPN domain-containing protein [Solirubrobacteraceae bacterium]